MMMTLRCVPRMEQRCELRLRQALVCECCRQLVSPLFYSEGGPFRHWVEFCRELEMCPACMTFANDKALERALTRYASRERPLGGGFMRCPPGASGLPYDLIEVG